MCVPVCGSAVIFFLKLTLICIILAQVHGPCKFLSAVRTFRAQTQTKSPEVLPESFCIQTMTAPAETTTLLYSDSRHQSNSLTTSDLCVWQPVTVCSTMVQIAGSLAWAQSWREVSLLVADKECCLSVI